MFFTQQALDGFNLPKPNTRSEEREEQQKRESKREERGRKRGGNSKPVEPLKMNCQISNIEPRALTLGSIPLADTRLASDVNSLLPQPERKSLRGLVACFAKKGTQRIADWRSRKS